MIDNSELGVSIANKAIVATQAPSNLSDLLALIDRKSNQANAMMHSTAARFLEYMGTTAELVSIDSMQAQKSAFLAHLESGKYTKGSVKSYSNYYRRLLNKATDLGWEPHCINIPPEWQEIAESLPRASLRDIVEYAIERHTSPASFSNQDLKDWRMQRGKLGLSIVYGEAQCSRFRNAIIKAGLIHKIPNIQIGARRYGVPLEEMNQALRKEIENVLAWKTNEFEIDRPAKARIRPITALRLKRVFCQIVGFVRDIQGEPEPSSVAELITRKNIVRFATWAKNERKISGRSLTINLGAIFASLRYQRDYSDLDLSWFPNLLDQLTDSSQIAAEERKAKKYISYKVAEQIPHKIKSQRTKLKGASPKKKARYARNELLMLWLVLLPWRQRNVREMRIVGSNPNLFKAPVREFSTLTQPSWIEEQRQLKPDSSFWQVQFAPHETKTGNSIQLFLPAELVPLLEEYISIHRPVLLGDRNDPGTLFLNNRGSAMTLSEMKNLVKKLAVEHSGVPATPHIFRDIVAYEWLRSHPEDYLTVSKLLWHRNINTTIRIYGRRFDESAGVARMEEWRLSRARLAA